ncbi:MAG: hypothetical protein HC945_01820 [Nitrosarchaeum sp.]|nr:hypothetical protein [Nitrosarchaeum sp.]
MGRRKVSADGLDASLVFVSGMYNAAPALREMDDASLLVRLREGEDDAARELIRRNLGLLVSIALRYEREYFDDLFQEAQLGFYQALLEVPPERAVTLKKYAGQRAAWAVKGYRGRCFPMISVGYDVRRRLLKTPPGSGAPYSDLLAYASLCSGPEEL